MGNYQPGRRTVLAAGVSALATGGLAACGAASKGPVEFEYWHINTKTFGLPAIQKAVSNFNDANDDIRVKARFAGASAYTSLLSNLQTAIAGGHPPGVAQIGYLYSDYVKANFPYVPLADLIDKYGPSDFLDQFAETSLPLAKTSDGEQFAAPYAISNVVMYMNGDVFKKHDLDADDPPTTWPQWRKLAEKYKEKTGKPLIYIQVLDDNWTNTALILSNGGSLTECKGGHPHASFDEPKATEAIQFWADLVKDGLCLNVPQPQGEQEFIAGHVPVYGTTIGKRASFDEASNFTLKGTKWPSFPGQKVKLPAGGNELVVFAQDEHVQEAAWKFIQSLYTPESITAWVKGTGYLPPTTGAVLEEEKYLGSYFKKYPIAELSREQLKNTVPWDYFPGPDGLEAGSKGFFGEGLQPALGGQKTAQQAADDAAKTVNAAIEGESCGK